MHLKRFKHRYNCRNTISRQNFIAVHGSANVSRHLRVRQHFPPFQILNHPYLSTYELSYYLLIIPTSTNSLPIYAQVESSSWINSDVTRFYQTSTRPSSFKRLLSTCSIYLLFLQPSFSLLNLIKSTIFVTLYLVALVFCPQAYVQ